MSDALPNWVWDILIDLYRQQLHPKLLYTSGGFEGYAQYDWCACNALALAPKDVQDQVGVLATYLTRAEVELPLPAASDRVHGASAAGGEGGE